MKYSGAELTRVNEYFHKLATTTRLQSNRRREVESSNSKLAKNYRPASTFRIDVREFSQHKPIVEYGEYIENGDVTST